MHWNTFLAVSSDTAFKSSAKSGLSSAHSNNNSLGRRAGCCCRQEGEVQQGTARGLQRTRAVPAPCPSCSSSLTWPSPCWMVTPAILSLCTVPEGLPVPWGQGRGCHWGPALLWRCQSVKLHIAAGPSPGPESSACLQATAPAESSLIYTQIIYSKSAFLTHAFILLYCNVST